MAASRQLQWHDVQQVLSGQPVKQVAFAQNSLMVGAIQGGVINIAPSGQRAADRIHPRHQPRSVLPRPVPHFVDREQEQGCVSRALARRQVVDLHGPNGMGKTALIRQTMATALPDAFPDGMVYLEARGEAYEDLLQDLFNRFFETDVHVKVNANDVRDYMAGKRALIAVDDANSLKQGEIESLVRLVPQCALLIAGQKQQVWEGVPLPLRALPRHEAVVLFERHWGPVRAEVRPTVEAICDALGNVPLPIVKAAWIAAARQVPLGEMLHFLQRGAARRDPVQQAFRAIARRLSEGEQQVLGGLTAFGTSAVGFDVLVSITGLSTQRINRYLARLQQMGLVYAADSHYSVDDGLRPHIQRAWGDDAMRVRAAAYYARRASQLRARSKDPDEENVMAALGHYLRRHQWQKVVDIARVVDSYLATSGRWGQWRRRLNQAWHAARELGDRRTEAWAQNQLGIIAMAAGDTTAAAGFFKAALGIWQALGDRAGATITCWNLQMLFGPPPPPPKGKPPAKPGGGLSPLTVGMGGLATVLIIVLVILASRVVVPDRPTPTLPKPITPSLVWMTITPTPTPTASHTSRAPTPTPSHAPRMPTLTPSRTPSRTPTATLTHTPTKTPTPTMPPPFVAAWSDCAWVGVETAGINSHQPFTWCPEGKYLAGLDLDSEASYSGLDSPVVGQALCCRLASMQYDREPVCDWVGVETAGINSHQPFQWCPSGRYLVGFDLDRQGSYSPLDSPVVGQARCCTLPDTRFDWWTSYTWVGVHQAGINSHQPEPWCPDGTFLTALDLDREGSYSGHDSPVVGQALCCGP